MAFELPALPYAYNALEPYIDEATMKLHHDKHHAGYVAKLNTALEKHPELQKKSIEELLGSINEVPADVQQTVVNNGGGHANHSLFWEIMGPGRGGAPTGKLLEIINRDFGHLEDFKKAFTEKAMGVFGSGWAFLMVNKSKTLEVKRHSFQNSPLMHGNKPVLGLDVWEHAYYLKYQNRRAEYVEAWWNVVNWEKVEQLVVKNIS